MTAHKSNGNSYAYSGRRDGGSWHGVDRDSWLQVDLGKRKLGSNVFDSSKLSHYNFFFIKKTSSCAVLEAKVNVGKIDFTILYCRKTTKTGDFLILLSGILCT